MSVPTIDNMARGLILVAGLAIVGYLAVWQHDGASVGLIIGAVGAAVGYFYPGKAAAKDEPTQPPA